MKYLVIRDGNKLEIKFGLYLRNAPKSCQAFIKTLPFRTRAVQARFAGEEIWLPKGPNLILPKENSSKNLIFGELGYAPINSKSEVANSIAIVYGEAKLSGSVNIFAKVLDNDKSKLKALGKSIWLEGARNLTFSLLIQKND